MTSVRTGLSAMWLLVLLAACHAEDSDAKGQAEELDDPVRREHAVGKLTLIHSKLLSEAKGDRANAGLKEFADLTHEQLVKTYIEHPEDTQNGYRILTLMTEMRDARTLPALLKALEWRRDVTEDHAVAAGTTMTKLDVSAGDKAKVVSKICEALERVEDNRGVDNRMRKGFIEVLGKLEDKGATDTLLKIMLSKE